MRTFLYLTIEFAAIALLQHKTHKTGTQVCVMHSAFVPDASIFTRLQTHTFHLFPSFSSTKKTGCFIYLTRTRV